MAEADGGPFFRMSHKLAVGMGVLFCTFVAILMVILYYPKDSVEEEFGMPKEFTPIGPVHYFDKNVDEEPQNSVKDIARSLEDFGAVFLALVAVGCVVAGLTCLACACCCLMG